MALVIGDTVAVTVKTSPSTKIAREFYRLRSTTNPKPVEEEMVPKLRPEDVEIATVMESGEEVLDVLGRGEYGNVFRATLRHEGESQHVVVKQCHTEYEDSKSLLREAQFVQRLQGTGFVPRLYGMVSGCDIDGVTLLSVLDDFQKLPQNIRRRVSCNLAVGLQAIHGRGVVLNDLHPGNVLVDLSCPNRSVQFIDMGMATYGPVDYFYSPSAPDKGYHLAPELGVWRSCVNTDRHNNIQSRLHVCTHQL
ncbi:hypothetical protein ACOMHN_028955 [Nucella lapillus]